MIGCDLAGTAVLVTRPAHQAAQLCKAIRELGGNAVAYPAIEVVAVAESELSPALSMLAAFDFVVFVSPNAANFGMKAIATAGGLSAGARVAATGPGTAAELKKSGLHEIITPRAGFDSESLAACPEFDNVQGKRVLIVRGHGGRELLARTLRQRGAEVHYLECYRRIRPRGDAADLDVLWRSHSIAGWTATSAEIVDNLFAIGGDSGRVWLCRTPLFVTHPRIAAAAFRRAVATILVTAPGDAGLAAGLATWFCRRRPTRTGTLDTP